MGSSMKEFSKRRQALMAQMQPESIGVLFASPVRNRNSDVDYPYRQNSHFYYLSGLSEPDAVLVLLPGENKSIIFSEERCIQKEIWEGRIIGQEDMVTEYLADEAYPIGLLAEKLPELMANKKILYGLWGQDLAEDTRLLGFFKQVQKRVRQGISAPTQLHLLQDLLAEMRLIKSDYEIEKMRYASEVSARAHKKAMEVTQAGKNERQIEAVFMHSFLDNHCKTFAYPSIVGGGANACVLHYTDNSETLQDGELLLIDAGAEYDHYAADITRTFPINGKFTEAQKAIYQLVLKSQLAAIDVAKPGQPWNKMQEVILPILTEGLLELGILKGELSTLLEQQAVKQFYMHNSGHWLGLDVHDVGAYKQNGEWRTLQAGMVLTIEPGLYIPANSEGVDEKWWNIGVRIEDDILITATGNEVLTYEVPKEVDEIERLMA